jgi:hypothetical protein
MNDVVLAERCIIGFLGLLGQIADLTRFVDQRQMQAI